MQGLIFPLNFRTGQSTTCDANFFSMSKEDSSWHVIQMLIDFFPCSQKRLGGIQERPRLGCVIIAELSANCMHVLNTIAKSLFCALPVIDFQLHNRSLGLWWTSNCVSALWAVSLVKIQPATRSVFFVRLVAACTASAASDRLWSGPAFPCLAHDQDPAMDSLVWIFLLQYNPHFCYSVSIMRVLGLLVVPTKSAFHSKCSRHTSTAKKVLTLPSFAHSLWLSQLCPVHSSKSSDVHLPRGAWHIRRLLIPPMIRRPHFCLETRSTLSYRLKIVRPHFSLSRSRFDPFMQLKHTMHAIIWLPIWFTESSVRHTAQSYKS